MTLGNAGTKNLYKCKLYNGENIFIGNLPILSALRRGRSLRGISFNIRTRPTQTLCYNIMTVDTENKAIKTHWTHSCHLVLITLERK